MTKRFLAGARTDLHAAADWYEARLPALGDHFVAEVNRTVQTIVAIPHQFSAVPRFPRGGGRPAS